MNCPHCSALNADDARFCGACGRATSATEPASNPHLASPAGGDGPSLIGREIAGRYRILAKLGEGGMGAVYRAEQMSLKRAVAVKLLRPEMAGSQLLLRRFNAEAEAVAKLSHPNTVNIYDFGQDADGTLFIAMEFIEGRSLRSVIQQEAPLPLRRALAIATQVAASLTDAHAHAIIHRDLKPDNVMLQDRGKQRDVVRVLDFGIAKLRDENRQSHLAMTQAGDMLGTPQYMAPEQIRGEAIDGRTDIYALGCMLYEMVTGRLPFEAHTVMALLSKHLLEAVVPPSQRRPDLALAPAIDQLILGAMAKDPAARPPTMEAFDEQIGALLATLPGEPTQSSAMAIQTPAAYSAAPAFAAPVGGSSAAPSSHAPFAPLTPPPPSTPPPPYSPGGPVASAPTPAPYDPYTGGASSFQPSAGPAATTSSKALWIALAVLVLVGGGAGLFFALRSNETTSEAERPDRAPDDMPDVPERDHGGSGADPWGPSNGSADPWAGHGTTGIVEPAGDEPDEPDEPVAPEIGQRGSVPPECEQIVRTMERMARCERIPEITRQQLKVQAEQVRASYASMQLTPAIREQIVQSCKQVVQQLEPQLAALGCQ